MDLKSLREDKLKIKTPEDFAALLEVDADVIRQWENDPNSVSQNVAFEIVGRICTKTGLSLENVMGWKKPEKKPLEVKDTWKKTATAKESFLKRIQIVLDQAELSDSVKKTYIEELEQIVARCIVKPKIAIVGRSDTGKSTLINSLLGTDKMPASWTPTTAIAVYIKHISDRPSFIHENAWIFSNHVGNQNAWDESRLNDEGYCKAWKIASGDVGLLKDYGVRQGSAHSDEAGSAVVFVDSPVLKNCDIIDLPGFGTERESDDTITFGIAPKAEVVIYLSQANGFMRSEDMAYLKQNISGLPVLEKQGQNEFPPLANLFIVASQAQNVNQGNREELRKILNSGCERLVKTIPHGYWQGRAGASGYRYEDNGVKFLRSRFFTYSTDIPDLCKPFEQSLAAVLEQLPSIVEEMANRQIKSYVERILPPLKEEIQQYEDLLKERQKYVDLLREIEKNEVARTGENDKRKQVIVKAIQQYRAESKQELSDFLAQNINVGSLRTKLMKSGYKNNKDDVESFASETITMVQNTCGQILDKKAASLAPKTRDYVDGFAQNVKKTFETQKISVGFDAGWAFTKAVGNVGVLGGVGAVGYGAISGAIICAQTGIASVGAGLLMGAQWLTPFFGPIGLAAGLGLAGTMALVKLFGGGWEKSVAKKIVEQFEKEHVGDKFRAGMDQFWEQTLKEFYQASAGMEESWTNYIAVLREKTQEYTQEELDQELDQLRNLENFFVQLTL